MKLYKKLAITVATLALGTASSSAALLLTFTEVGDDVVMQTTGTLDISSMNFVSDDAGVNINLQKGLYYNDFGEGSGLQQYNSWEFLYNQGGTQTLDVEVSDGGVSLVSGIGNPWSSATTAYASNGNNGFSFDSRGTFKVINPAWSDTMNVDDNQRDSDTFSSDMSMTWYGKSLADMGLDQHASDTEIGIWKASADAGDAGTINILVVAPEVAAVPEPSSAALLGLGSLGLLLRRRR